MCHKRLPFNAASKLSCHVFMCTETVSTPCPFMPNQTSMTSLPLTSACITFIIPPRPPPSEIWCFIACLCVSWHKHEIITTKATFPSYGVSHLKWRSYLLKPEVAIFVINLCNASSPSPLCARMIVCNQVMKFILDRIDKDERQAAKRRKKEEVVEAKRRLANASKLSSLLYRHKESLKMEILKKRALLDKELQLEAQV